MLHGAHNNAAMYYGSFCSLLAGRPPPPPRPRHQEVPPPQRQQRVRARTHDYGRRTSPDSPRSTTPPPEPLQLPDDTLGWDALAGQAANVDALKVALDVLLMPDTRRAPRASTNNGVLLTGPPGTGKTLAVRLLAGRAKALNGGTAVPLWVVNGGELLSKFIGEGEQRVRRVIDAATAAQPSIIFFDEFEAITAARTDGRQESIPMIATLLALLDGLVRRDRVFVVAATNRVDLIDRAFRRPGRFGTELPFGLPDAAGRWAIMRVSAAAEGVRMTAADATWIADHIDDWSVAELAGLCDDAATTVFARRFTGWPDSFEKVSDNAVDLRVDWKDTFDRRKRSTRLGAPPPLRRPLPQRVSSLLTPTLTDVNGLLTRHFPVRQLRSMTGRCTAAAAVGCGVDTAFSGMAAGLPILPQRLLIDGDDGMRQGTFAAAVLHALTPMPIYDAGFASLTRGAGARNPQQRLAETIYAATLAAPAVLFIPLVELWVDDPSAGDSTDLQFFEAALRDVPVGTPLLVLTKTDRRARRALLAIFPSTFSVESATKCAAPRLLGPHRQGVHKQGRREGQVRCTPASPLAGRTRTDGGVADTVGGLERRRDGARV